MSEHKQEVLFTTFEEGQSGVPVRGSTHAAGWDITAAESVILEPYKAVRIKTNLCIEIPPEFFLAVVPRSGFSTTHQIYMTNSIGVVDADYRGEISLPFMWMPEPTSVLEITHPMAKQFGPDGCVIGERLDFMRPQLTYKKTAVFHVDKGMRIAQALLMRYHEQSWRYVDELTETGRGANGFGSTGV